MPALFKRSSLVLIESKIVIIMSLKLTPFSVKILLVEFEITLNYDMKPSFILSAVSYTIITNLQIFLIHVIHYKYLS